MRLLVAAMLLAAASIPARAEEKECVTPATLDPTYETAAVGTVVEARRSWFASDPTARRAVIEVDRVLDGPAVPKRLVYRFSDATVRCEAPAVKSGDTVVVNVRRWRNELIVEGARSLPAFRAELSNKIAECRRWAPRSAHVYQQQCAVYARLISRTSN